MDTFVLNKEILWLQKIYNCKTKNEIMESILLLYRKINFILSEGNFVLCQEILEKIEINKLSTELKVGLLRITYPAKKHFLSSWKQLFDKIKESFDNNNEESNSLLSGLEE